MVNFDDRIIRQLGAFAFQILQLQAEVERLKEELAKKDQHETK